MTGNICCVKLLCFQITSIPYQGFIYQNNLHLGRWLDDTKAHTVLQQRFTSLVVNN